MHNHNKRRENIKVALFVNLTFTLIEFFGGIWTNSLAITSDALHDLGDSVTLFFSYLSEKFSSKSPDQKRTFGYQRLSLFSAFLASTVLVGGSLFILYKAIPRLLNPQDVNSEGMIILAIVGVVFNGFAAFKLKQGESMNEKVLTWHLLEDVFGWLAVLFGSIAIKVWNLPIIDPIITIIYTGIIFGGVLKSLKEVINIFLQGVPSHIDINHIRTGVLSLKEVVGIHDIHVWSLDGENDIFTAHVVVPDKHLEDLDKTRKIVKAELAKHHIEHSTIELESRRYCSGDECSRDDFSHKD